MEKIELSIIIVDYNSLKFTIELVDDLLKHLKALKYEIIIVDNDPNGDSAEKLKALYLKDKRIKALKNDKNSGYGSGNNLGAKHATGEYILLLNPDVKIVDDSIERMLDFMSKHSEVGALSPLIYQTDAKNLQRHFFGDFQSMAGITFQRWRGKTADLSKEFFYAEMITGAALLISRELYEKLGGFDENFFMYMEDDDLCRRISNLGLKNAVLTTARVMHYEGQSSTSYEKKKFYYKSQDYYWQKHYGSFKTVLMKIIRYPYILLQKLNNRDIKQ
jgi:hypothetical protein